MFCKNCGKEIIPGKRFCGGCGAPVEQAQPQTQERQMPVQNQPSPKKKGGKIALAVIIPILVIAAAVAVLFATGVISFNKDDSSDKSDGKEKSSEVGEADEEDEKDSDSGSGAKSSFNAADVDVGKTIKFGSYEQDYDTSNGKEDIEWIVLAKENGRALIISKYTLDCKPYNEENTEVTWETCTLRKWLNEDFYNTAFSSSEQSKIQTSTVTADKNPKLDTSPGDDTQDKVFLLSCDEADKYFNSDEARLCAATAYAKKQGVYTYSGYKTSSGEETCYWQLRTPGYDSYHACIVYSSGYVYSGGHFVYNITYGIRPALWINLKS